VTDRLGGSGREPRFDPLGPLQGPQPIGPLGAPGGHPAARPAGPRYKSDGLELSEPARAHYAALIDGAPDAGADPELMLRLQVVHGPSSDLVQALRASPAGRERLARPAGDPARALPPAPEADEPGPVASFFSRTFAELGFAWRNFSESQRW
jgi:hypothetical protein